MSLDFDELEQLKRLLRRGPQPFDRDRRELEALYAKADATDLLTLMREPDLDRQLRRLEPVDDFRWSGSTLRVAVGLAVLAVLFVTAQLAA